MTQARSLEAGYRRHFQLLLFALSFCVAGCFDARAASPGAGVDWYRWRGPDLNGISKETGWFSGWPKEGPRTLWKASVGQGFSSFAVSQGRLYTMGVVAGQETVWCLDAASGAVLWKQSYPYVFKPQYYEGGSSATPTVDGDRVYTLGQAGELNCWDAASGKAIWSKNIARELDAGIGTWGLASSPVVEDELIILNIGSHGTALDKRTGKTVWTTGQEQCGYSSAVPFTQGGRRGVLLMVASGVAGVDVKTGKAFWQYPWKTSYDVNATDPVIAGDRVFVSSGYDHGCVLLKLTAASPARAYENKNMRNMFNSCVLIGGHLYGIDGDNDKQSHLRCIDLATGSPKWTHTDFKATALMAADGKLIVQGDAGELAVVEASPAGCKVPAKTQVLGGRCWTTPVLSHGRIYCRNSKGDLVCLAARGEGTNPDS